MARPSDGAPLRKQEILEHFYKVLGEEGIEGTSLAKIAGSMGVHPSLLIHYFSNKEQMTIALVDYMTQLYNETYLGRISGIEDPKMRLDAILDMLFSKSWMGYVDQSVFSACHYLGFRNKEILKRFRKMYSRFADMLSAEFERLMELGVIKEIDPRQLADLVIAMIEGLDFYGTIIGTGQRFDSVGKTMKQAALALLVDGEGSTGDRGSASGNRKKGDNA